MDPDAYPDALPPHYRLHWYELEGVLGQGGFGITYLARDQNLNLRVAIKEYLPVDAAHRRSDACVRPRTQALDERYRWGLARFIEEARTLARFDHPNIVRVQSVFEANDTAYMVMRFEEGENLGTLLDRRGTLPADELLRVLMPIVEGLERVHEAGFIHRDIKPENIYIRRDGSPVLLDFGSARMAVGLDRSMTVLVAPGYAALEQYYGEADAQGPWTDIYGLAATGYRAIAGVPPPDAVVRARGRLGSTVDTLVSARERGRGRYGDAFLAAIDHGLQLAEADRPQTLAAWRRELLADGVPVAPRVAAAAMPTLAPAVPEQVPGTPAEPRARPLAAPLVLLAGALTVGGTVWWWTRPSAAPPQGAPSTAAPASEVVAKAASPASAPLVSVAAEPASASPPAPAPLPVPAAPAEPAPSPPAARQAASAPARVDRMERATLAAAVRRPPDPAPTPPSQVRPPESTPAAPPPAAVEAPVAAPAPVVTAVAAPDPIQPIEDAMRRGDDATAYRLARALGNQGHGRALELLGRLTEEGRGTVRSPLQAYVWYGLAAQRGHASARAAQDRVARRLQPAELAQADKLVLGWQPQ